MELNQFAGKSRSAPFLRPISEGITAQYKVVTKIKRSRGGGKTMSKVTTKKGSNDLRRVSLKQRQVAFVLFTYRRYVKARDFAR